MIPVLPYVVEIQADDVVLHHADMPVDKVLVGAGGPEFTVEFWTTALPKFKLGKLRIDHTDELVVNKVGMGVDLGDGAAHQVAVTSDGATWTVVVDGQVRGTLPAAANRGKWAVPMRPVLDFALYDTALPASRLLSHVLVRDGLLPPTRPDRDHPIEFRTQSGHSGAVSTLAVSADGRLAATGGFDGRVMLWDLHAGLLVRDIDAHSREVQRVALSPDGRTVASVGVVEREIRFWDVADGELRGVAEWKERATDHLAFAPDGRSITVGRFPGTMARFDFASNERIDLPDVEDGVEIVVDGVLGHADGQINDGARAWKAHDDRVRALAISPTHILSGGDDQRVKLWDRASRTLLHDWSAEAEHYDGPRLLASVGDPPKVRAVAFHPDGELVAASGFDPAIKVWSTTTGELVHELNADGGSTNALAFTADGRFVVSANEGKTFLSTWDVRSGARVHAFRRRIDRINRATPHPDGQLALTVGADEHAEIWDLTAGRLLHLLGPHERRITKAVWSEDGRRVATGTDGGAVHVFDTASGRELWSRPKAHQGSVYGIAWRRGRLATSDWDGDVVLWDAVEGVEARRWHAHGGEVLRVAFDESGQFLASGGGKHAVGGEVRVYDTDSGDVLHEMSLRKRVKGLWVEDGSVVALSDKDVRTWNLQTGEPDVWIDYHDSDVDELAWVGDQWVTKSRNTVVRWQDGRVAEVHDARKVDFADVAAGIGHVVAEPVPGAKGRAMVSPDGRYTVMAGYDVVVYDKKGKKLHRWKKAGKQTVGPAGAFDGNLFITQRLRRFDLRTGDEKDALHPVDHLRGLWTRKGRTLGVNRYGRLFIWGDDDEPPAEQALELPAEVDRALFSEDGSRLLLALDGGGLVEVDVTTLETRAHRVGHRKPIQHAALRDGQLFTGSMDGTAILWDVATGDVVTTVDPPGRGMVHHVALAGEHLLTASGDTVHRWNRAGEAVGAWQGHPEGVATGVVAGAHLLSTGSDAKLRIWSADGAAMSLVNADDDWLLHTDDGYFDLSADGAGLVAMGQGSRVYGVDQLALQYNRPDVVLSRLGLGDEAVLEHFRRLWERRLAKAGVRPEALADGIDLPRVSLVAGEPVGGSVPLTLDLADDNGLVGWQVWVDDVPAAAGTVEGTRATVDVDVPLTGGLEKIEVAARNERGQESLRALHYVRSEARKGALWFVGLGVSDYADDVLDLKWAAKDATDLAKQLGGSSAFRAVHTHAITDANVDADVLERVTDLLADAKPEDTLVFFIAGHGLHDDAGDYYFLGHGAQLADLPGTALSFDRIEAVLRDAVPRNKLFLMDTCESGEVDEAVETEALAHATTRGLRSRAIVELSALQRARRRAWLADRDRFIFVDLARRSGAVVFSSSRGGEFSYEDDGLQNGLFTEALLEALSGVGDLDEDGAVDLEELQRTVTKLVRDAAGGLQNPTVDRDNLTRRFGFPVP